MLEPLQTPSTDNDDEDGHSADIAAYRHLHAILTSFQCDCAHSQRQNPINDRQTIQWQAYLFDWCGWCTWYWYETTFMNLIALICDKKATHIKRFRWRAISHPLSVECSLNLNNPAYKMQMTVTNWRLTTCIIRMVDDGSSSWYSFDIPKSVEGLTNQKKTL